uniref:Uncharacterized protein n=1 Tax=Phaeocystis antarctica TaxID=33657 RepID=A0A7S0HBN0_9EUKA
MGYLPPGRITWPLPIKYLGGQVTLRAMKRLNFGTHQNVTLREQGFIPARLQGDWLPDKWLQLFNNELRAPSKAPGFQRRLLKLILDDGEEVLAMPKQADRTIATKLVEVTHVGFVRWPRDPENNPLKLNIPVTVVNEDKMPVVKRGGYVHNMFSCLGGLPCTVETPDFPHTIVADMDLADSKGDFRWEHLEKQLPPGVTLQRGLRGFTDHPNFLVARAKKVRGS